MARGWESKAIESQQEEAQRRGALPGRAMTGAEREAASRRRTLELARARAKADLDRATRPAHRAMLERTIAGIDEQLGA